jgi:glutamate-ammonia-ligase adenylyltransferase
MHARFARLRAFAEACDADATKEIASTLGGGDEAATTLAQAIGAAYPALRGLALRRFDALQTIAKEGWRQPRKRSEMLRRFHAACGDLSDAAQVRRGLRIVSATERLRIALRELEPDVEIDVTAREWSELAEAQLEMATLEARAFVEGRLGKILAHDGDDLVRNGFVVIGLGKLGGMELNAGSDVDVMFVHASDEGPDVREGLRPFDAFGRIARRLVPTIEEHDDDGFCARIDLRLRPEGGSGPITNSIAAAVGYYETFGVGWERAALVRARPVAGDLEVGERLLRELAPFVYRRAVDPGVSLEMHEMARRARIELSEAPARDLKLGPGGIREAEFFVQTLQLVWGGKDPSLRATNTLHALRKLRARGYVTDREARAIADGYPLLRRVEHRVQLSTGLQTHVVPLEGVERDRIARSLGYRDGAELWHAIERARQKIGDRFASLVPGGAPRAEETRVRDVLRAIDSDGETTLSRDLVASLRGLARRPDAPLGERTRGRHGKLVEKLVSALLDAADPELAASLVRTFFDRLSVPGVESYVRAFEGDERALARFVGLCGASAYLGGSLVGHPELVDRLLFGARAVGIDPARGARVLAEEVAALGAAERDDAESFVGALRRAKSAVELEVGMADLAGEIDPREASRTLSSIADATLEATTSWSLEEIARRKNLRTPGAIDGLAVLAMGKLGGREIGYGSDLDVVFVYDARGLEAVGLDPIDAPDVYGRAAARIVRLLSTPHSDGVGYELDTRLRPSGEQGHLVVSLDAFRAYHLDGRDAGPRAADWERQALLRLRPAAGDPRVGAAAAEIATLAAYERAPIAPAELLRLRARLEAEVARERPGRFDPKLGVGGLADVELAVQYLQMCAGAESSVRTPETLVALDALESLGRIEPRHATTLRDGYRFLRRLEQRARVVHSSRSAVIEAGAPGLVALARSMGYRDGPRGAAADQMLATYAEVTREVRAAFVDVVR